MHKIDGSTVQFVHEDGGDLTAEARSFCAQHYANSPTCREMVIEGLRARDRRIRKGTNDEDEDE